MSIFDTIQDGYDFFKDNSQDVNTLLKESGDLLNQLGLTKPDTTNNIKQEAQELREHIISRETSETLTKYMPYVIGGSVLFVLLIFLAKR